MKFFKLIALSAFAIGSLGLSSCVGGCIDEEPVPPLQPLPLFQELPVLGEVPIIDEK